jgi:hypothetical protein
MRRLGGVSGFSRATRAFKRTNHRNRRRYQGAVDSWDEITPNMNNVAI